MIIAFVALYDSVQQIGVDGRLDPIDVFNFPRLGGDDARHPVDDESDRLAIIHDDDPGGVVVNGVFHAEDASQVDDREDRSPQIGEALETGRRHRHFDHGGQSNYFLHVGKGNRECLLFYVESPELREVVRSPSRFDSGPELSSGWLLAAFR